MDINKFLIFIKKDGVFTDRTKDVEFWRPNYNKIDIKFYNNETIYGPFRENVKIYENPEKVLPSKAMLLNDEKPIVNMDKALVFENHVRIFYKSGYNKLYERKEIKTVQSCLSDPKSNNCFEYLKEVAHTVEMEGENGKSILGKYYDEVDFVHPNSTLAAFLNGKMPVSQTKHSSIVPIYP